MKFIITNELATVIKTMRIQRKIASKDLAACVGKSPSYSSKLENGEARYIQEEELSKILDYIVEGDDFFEDKLPVVIKTLSGFLDPEKMPQQLWLLNYDIVMRPISIPGDMIDDINLRLERLGLSIARLTERISANRDSTMSAGFPENELLDYRFQDIHLLLIRFHVDEFVLNSLLAKKSTQTNYALINALVFSIMRLEEFGEARFGLEDGSTLLEMAQVYLNDHGVYSLTGFEFTQNRQLNKDFMTKSLARQQEENSNGFSNALLSVVNAASKDIIDDIVNSILVATEHDALYMAHVLETLKSNLVWDTSFMLRLISQEFYKLDQISFSQKKQLIDEMADTLERFRER
jgi:DNA-binding Xre family transcriptional regulator